MAGDTAGDCVDSSSDEMEVEPREEHNTEHMWHVAARRGTPRHARHVHQFYICHLLDWSSKSEHSTARGARRSMWGTPRHVGVRRGTWGPVAAHGDPQRPTVARSVLWQTAAACAEL